MLAYVAKPIIELAVKYGGPVAARYTKRGMKKAKPAVKRVGVATKETTKSTARTVAKTTRDAAQTTTQTASKAAQTLPRQPIKWLRPRPVRLVRQRKRLLRQRTKQHKQLPRQPIKWPRPLLVRLVRQRKRLPKRRARRLRLLLRRLARPSRVRPRRLVRFCRGGSLRRIPLTPTPPPKTKPQNTRKTRKGYPKTRELNPEKLTTLRLRSATWVGN